jgi:hypothetical protein
MRARLAARLQCAACRPSKGTASARGGGYPTPMERERSAGGRRNEIGRRGSEAFSLRDQGGDRPTSRDAIVAEEDTRCEAHQSAYQLDGLDWHIEHRTGRLLSEEGRRGRRSQFSRQEAHPKRERSQGSEEQSYARGHAVLLARGRSTFVSDYLPRSIPQLPFTFVSQFSCLAQPVDLFGERAGARTRDLLIKSQLLYRLSYALRRAWW